MHAARHAVGLAALAVALVLPASAPAQSGDPAEGSPSGVIYEIPLDNARQDAAPTRKSGGGGSGSQGGTVSPIRSENGFGSSSTVPGAATQVAAAAAASGGKSKSKSKSGGSGSGGSSGSGAEGTGGAAAPGTASEGTRSAGTATVTPSKSRAYLLLLLALAVAAGLGVAGRYVARRR